MRLRLLPSEAKALRHWTPVHIHLGAADLSGRVGLLEGASLAPDGTAFGQLILDTPTSALTGDRFVLRDQSARRTIDGGRVIDPRPPLRNARKPERLAVLRALEAAEDGGALDALLACSPDGLDLEHFGRIRNLEPVDLSALSAFRAVVEVTVNGGRRLFDRWRWEDLQAGLFAALEAYQARIRRASGRRPTS